MINTRQITPATTDRLRALLPSTLGVVQRQITAFAQTVPQFGDSQTEVSTKST